MYTVYSKIFLSKLNRNGQNRQLGLCSGLELSEIPYLLVYIPYLLVYLLYLLVCLPYLLVYIPYVLVYIPYYTRKTSRALSQQRCAYQSVEITKST